MKTESEYRIFGLKIFEKRSATPITTNPSDIFSTSFNEIGGVSVNSDTALSLSAVWRAINVISGTLAGLPLHVYERGAGGRKHLYNSDAEEILRNPNGLMTGYIFKESLQASALGFGNGYAYIQRDYAGDPIELIPIHPQNCNVFKQDNRLWYMVLIDGKTYSVQSENILHIPGLSYNGTIGFSPLTVARESLAGAIATQRFSNKFYENGANIGGVLTTPGEMSEPVYERLKSSWSEKYSGLDNSYKPAILEGGAKFEKIGIAPEEAQFLQTRQFQVTEIARWFGVPPHLLMDLERSTNNNIEQQGMEFVQYTLLPWANRWEEELRRKLIRYNRQKLEYFEFEFNGLLRADAKSRAEYYKSLFAIASITPNQIAELENLPKSDNGDTHYVQGAYVPTDKIGDFYTSKVKK